MSALHADIIPVVQPVVKKEFKAHNYWAEHLQERLATIGSQE